MAKPSIVECSIPPESEIFNFTGVQSYSDCYTTAIEPGTSATDAYRAVFGNTPEWVMSLMSLRNKIAAKVGLKHFTAEQLESVKNSIHEVPYEVGQGAGMFSVVSVSEKELIVGDDDKHLNFRISILIKDEPQPVLYMSTIVDENNFMGRTYMFFVKPFHRFIAPYVVRKAKADGRL